MSEEAAIRAASARFYEALNRLIHGDPSTMVEAWHHSEQATTVHPMGTWVHGWEQIWASWQELAQAQLGGSVQPLDLKVFIYGDFAYTTGIEDVVIAVGGRELRWQANVTNAFQRRDGVWKMVHHHSDKSPNAERAIEELS